MSKFAYAQIDAQGVVVGLARLSKEVNDANMVPLSTDHSIELGMVYSDGSFEDAPPVEPEKLPITKLQFRRLFTPEERVAWELFGEQEGVTAELLAQWKVLNRDFDMASNIRLDDYETISGVNLMEQVGIIGQGRAAQVLAGEAPE